jgi:hypothetical protein
MNKKKVLPAALVAASMAAEAVVPSHHSPALPQQHVELNVAKPSADDMPPIVSASGGGKAVRGTLTLIPDVPNQGTGSELPDRRSMAGSR